MKLSYRSHINEGSKAGQGLALQLPHRLPEGISGTRLSGRAGASLDFLDYRQYTPGDDLRHVDWNACARTDHLFVKRHREEVTPHLDVILDDSASMSLHEDKMHAALGLAACLCSAAASSGCTNRLWLAGNQCKPVGRAGIQPAQWEGISFDHSGEILPGMRAASASWQRLGIRILISDLLWPTAPMHILACLSRGAAKTAVIFLPDEKDLSPGPPGHGRIQDAETGELQDIFISETYRQHFARSLSRHRRAWHRAARERSCTFLETSPDHLIPHYRAGILFETGLLAVK